MIKKLLLILIFAFAASMFAQQTGYVEYNHKVYSFLERMETQHFIDNYDAFEIPKTRKTISGYLKQLIEVKTKLSSVDRQILDDLLNEFELDLSGTTENYSSFYEDGFDSVLNQKEKFLYYSTDKNKSSLFINGLVNFTNLYENNRVNDAAQSANLIQFGGVIRGTIYENFGFMIKGTNGTFSGDKPLILNNTSLKYNYKFSADANHQSGTDYFDETEGYFMAEFENINFKLGRDRSVLGYGINKTILGAETPPMDYFSLSFNYSILNYTFYHGKLLGTVKESVAKEDVIDKFFVYHRFSFDFGKHLNFGMGEMVIYADRSIDLSYLNPFNFYKSVEHLNQDRDNSMLFFDFENRSIKGLKLYGLLVIDDLDFKKIGTGWYGNKTLVSFGAQSTNFYYLLPIDMAVEYIRVQPYVYTHRFYKNNYTSLNYSLIDPVEPNSDILSAKINYNCNSRVSFSFRYLHKRHGRNIYDKNGKLLFNAGGDILQGHRTQDPEQVNFMDGIKETTNSVTFNASIEPYKNYLILLDIYYSKTTKKNKIPKKNIGSQLKFMLRL